MGPELQGSSRFLPRVRERVKKNCSRDLLSLYCLCLQRQELKISSECCANSEFKGLTRTQLETQRTGLSCEKTQCQDNQAARHNLQRMAGKEPAHPRLENHQPAPIPRQPLRACQGTANRTPCGSLGSFQTEGREERRIHSA